MNGCVGVLGLIGRSEESEVPRVISGAGPRSAVVSDPGVSAEVGERLLASDGMKESEVSPSGEVGVGLPGSSGVLVGCRLASGVNKAEVIGEGSPGVGGDALGGPEVPFCLEAEPGMSRGQEPEVCREPGGAGAEEAAGDEAVCAGLAEVGRSGRRSGFGFLGDPGAVSGRLCVAGERA